MRTAAALLLLAVPTFVPRLDDPRIRYYEAAPRDLVADLDRRLADGTAKLEFGEKWGYLESVLRELKVPVSSQALVFSKTSLQVAKISPEHPRAIYFADDVYVAMVRGGLIELAAVDPTLGAVFYTLEQKKAAQPRLLRRNAECLNCHFTVNTSYVPGFLTRSVHANAAGEPMVESGSYLTDHHSPIVQRWGGWYVTGTHGAERHLGNVFANGSGKVDVERGANVVDLKGRVNAAQYPVPSSDLVALLVLNHQVQLHNLITRLGYEFRLGRTEWKDTVESVVRYMLFADEAQLRYPVAGTSPFRAEFEARGPADGRGRSLRQMDLDHRLFRYPCSYLIYSESFDALPDEPKQAVYRRIWEILNVTGPLAGYGRLSADDRRAILEILAATKPGLPAYFRP